MLNNLQKEMLLVLLGITTFCMSIFIGVIIGTYVFSSQLLGILGAILLGATHNFIVVFFIAGKIKD